MGLIKNKKTAIKKVAKPTFADGRCRVNIKPDLILNKETGKKQLFVHKAFNNNQDKTLPIHEREFFIVTEKRVTAQDVGNKEYTIWSKKNGHADWGQVQQTLKHLGWMDTNQVQERKDRQAASTSRAKEKAKLRHELRKKGLLDAKGSHAQLMNF